MASPPNKRKKYLSVLLLWFLIGFTAVLESHLVPGAFKFLGKEKRLHSLLCLESVLYRFGEVFREDMIGIFEIGNRSREFYDAVIGADGEVKC